MPNYVISRAQSGQVAVPNQLSVQQVMVDPFVRERQPTGAGSDLTQLGAALNGFNPGINRLLADADQKAYQDKLQSEQAAGASDRENIRDAVEAQSKMQSMRGVWSEARMQGYEMADAQVHANTYPAALKNALMESGLWNNEKADPQKVADVFAQVRQQYLQRGDGSGPVWQKTFDQYRQGFENGAMNQWVENVNHVREVKSESMVLNDLTTQAISHAQLDTVDNMASFFNGYAEKSYANLPIPLPKLNALKAEAFQKAHAYAVNAGNRALADKIAAAFEKIPTVNEAGQTQYLASTAVGVEALTKMHNDIYSFTRQQMEERQLQKEERRQQIMGVVSSIRDQYRGKPASQIPPTFPDPAADAQHPEYADLRKDAAEMGYDVDAHWLQWREMGMQAGLQVRAEDTQAADDAVAQVRTQLRRADTKSDLDAVGTQLFNMDTNPIFSGASQRERYNDLLKEFNDAKQQYTEVGKVGSRAYALTERDVHAFGQQMAAEAVNAVRNENKDPLGMTKFFTMSASPDGVELLGFGDINRKMMQRFADEADLVEPDVPWSKKSRKALREAADRVQGEFKPLYDQRIKAVNDELATQKQQLDASRSQANLSDTAVSAYTSEPVIIRGPSKLPTMAGVRNIQSATDTLDWVMAYDSANEAKEAFDTVAALDNSKATLRSHWYNLTADPSTRRANVQSIIDSAHVNNRAYTWKGGDRPYIHGTSFGGSASLNTPMANLAELLSSYEEDPKLVEALHHTAKNSSMDPYESTKQAIYARSRAAYEALGREVGFPTNLSTADKPPFKPEWVDFTQMPMFSRGADVTPENVDKLIKNLKLDPKSPQVIPLFQSRGLQPSAENLGTIVGDMQRWLIQNRIDKYDLEDK